LAEFRALLKERMEVTRTICPPCGFHWYISLWFSFRSRAWFL